MKLRSLALSVVLASAVLVTPAGARPLHSTADPTGAVVGATYGRGVGGPGSYAVLIDVHSIKPYKGKPAARANCSNPGATSASEYATTGWTIDTVLPVRLNPATVPAQLGNIADELQASWNAWQVTGGVPAVTVTSTSTVTKYTANQVDDLLFGRTGGSLATTYTWRWNNGLVESDTVFDKAISWRNLAEGDGCDENAGGVYDVRNIATHEFGHSYGLDHPNPGRFETMYAYGYSGETLKWTPGAGDVAGMQSLY